MVYQQVVPKRKMGIIYNYIDYKKRAPFFREPKRITLATSPNESYLLVKNIVYKEKQILALKNEQLPDVIFLVEAIIDNGKLISVSKLPDDYINSVSKMMEDLI